MSPTCVIGEADPFLTLLLQRFAEESGMTMQLSRLGEHVLDLVRASLPDVLIVDPELPGAVRGWEVIRAIRADAQLCQVHIVTCGWLDPGETRALTGVTTAHLQKPDLAYSDFLIALKSVQVRGPQAPAAQDSTQPRDPRREQ